MPFERRIGSDRREMGLPWYKTTGGRVTFVLFLVFLAELLDLVGDRSADLDLDRERQRSCLVIAHFDIPDPEGLCR